MRPANRVIVLLVGLALVGVGTVVAIEAVLLRFRRRAWLVPRGEWDDGLRGLEWSSTPLRLALAGLAVAGVALVVAQLWPRAPRALPVVALEGDGRRMRIDRRSLETRLRHRALAEPEVDHARARVGRRRAVVVAGVHPGTDQAEVRARLLASLRGEGHGLGLDPPLAVRLSTETSKARAR